MIIKNNERKSKRSYFRTFLFILIYIAFIFIAFSSISSQLSGTDVGNSFFGFIFFIILFPLVIGSLFAYIFIASFKIVNRIRLKVANEYIFSSQKRIFSLAMIFTFSPLIYILILVLIPILEIFLFLFIGGQIIGSLYYYQDFLNMFRNFSQLLFSILYLFFLPFISFYFVNYFSLKNINLTKIKLTLPLFYGFIIGIIIVPISVLISMLLFFGFPSGDMVTYGLFSIPFLILIGILQGIFVFLSSFLSIFLLNITFKMLKINKE